MFKRIVHPTVEPISIEDLKIQARYSLTDTSQDTLFTRKIKAARTWIERYCRIAMISQSVEQKYSFFPSCIPLECTSYLDTLVITYKDKNDADQTLASSEYEIVSQGDMTYVYMIGTMPAIAAKRIYPITVTYNAGFGDAATDVPADLQEAVLILATKMEADRVDPDAAIGLIGHLIHTYKNQYATP